MRAVEHRVSLQVERLYKRGTISTGRKDRQQESRRMSSDPKPEPTLTKARPRAGEVRYVLANAFYGMAFTEWGPVDAPPVVCVHGLTRNGRDFDPLAEALSDRFRVICPDLPGRGGSDWLPNPALYEPVSYVQALSHLFAMIGGKVAFVGTSLGGICGMGIAACPRNPIARLVLNDIGPYIAEEGLRRIREYLPDPDQQARFPDIDAVERHLRSVHSPFGPMTDAQWAHLARTSARALPDGGYTMHYDPKIASPIKAAEPKPVELWPVWEKINIPTLAIRGETSDLLVAETLARMERTGARALTIEGVGHAPSLMDAPTIAAIRGFLLES
jgi:pimeloyl-ACP methyl ester carboxylesterase